MRTVTFSDPEVVRQLNESFVCAWINKRPSEEFKDGRRPRDIEQQRNGTGVANITSVFAAPDGTVIHAMAGSLDVRFFSIQIEFAKDLRHRMYKEGEMRPHGEACYVAAHQTARGVTDALVSGVHAVLARKLLNVETMPLSLFDRLAERGRACKNEVRPAVCRISAISSIR
jgi:hypothetical protein